MDIQRIKDSMSRRGVSVTIRELAYRAANKVTDVRILCAMTLTPATVDPAFLEESAGMTWGFLDEEYLLRALEQGADADMDREFIRSALERGDRCYGALDDDGAAGRIAAYGWYADRPTSVTDGLELRFDPAWAYMYKGYTLPGYRGRRLHGLAMARAMRAHVEAGKKGLVSYVDAANEASLRSCRRMGYRDLGHLVAVRIGGRWITHAASSCAPYGLALAEAGEPSPPVLAAA